MRHISKQILFISIGLLFISNVVAQKAVATLDSVKILMGKQANLSLQVTIKQGTRVLFPMINDTAWGKVEVVDRSKIDTINKSGTDLVLRQVLKVTSWTEGKHLIPQLTFEVKNGAQTTTINSNELFLDVLSLKVDTTQAIKDIKAPIETPMTIKEFFMLYYPYIIAVLGLIILIVALIYVIKIRKVVPGVNILKKAMDPPDIIAINSLKALKEKKLWQQDLVKEYHSELTDILRIYIEHRFSISAMEQTTNEIIGSFKIGNQISQNEIDILFQILYVADMVKFAKGIPLPDENERSITNAVNFVAHSAPKIIEKEENIENEINSQA